MTAGRGASRHWERAALVDVCQLRAPVRPPGDGAAEQLVDAVRRHRVAPLAYVALRDAGDPLAAVLRPDRDAAMAGHIRATACLAGLVCILGGVPWLTVKGPVLSEHAHPLPGLRTYRDLDLLVSPTDLREVSDRLRRAGWRLLDAADALQLPAPMGEMHWQSPDGIVADLHWTLINSAGTRRHFRLDTDDLLARRVSVDVGLTTVATLAPDDALAHTCLHASLTGAQRMLLVLDVDRLARRVDDWDATVERAHAWGAGPAAAIVLGRARSLLGTPLPDRLDHRLQTSAAFRLVTRATDRLAPVSSVRHEASMTRMVARAARPSGTASLGELGRKSVRGVTERAGRLARFGATARAVRRAPTAADLDAFLRAVESEAATAS